MSLDPTKRYYGVRYIDPQDGRYKFFPAVFLCNPDEDMKEIGAILSARVESMQGAQMDMIQLTDPSAIEILESYAEHVHIHRCIEGLPE